MTKARLLNENNVIIGHVDIPEGPYPEILRVGPTLYKIEVGSRLTTLPSYRATTHHEVKGKIEMRTGEDSIPVKAVGDIDHDNEG